MDYTFFFRTNSIQRVGIGHLSRCKNLARVFRQRGAKVTFLIDKYDGISAKFLEDFPTVSIYSTHEEFVSQVDDADRVVRVLGATKLVSAIIVDDYRLDATWERKVASKALSKIVAIDDVQREHFADIVDPKWQGEKTSLRYDGLVGQKCLKLLGPKYCQ